MLLFLEQCLNGLQFGLLLFLLAAGLTLVFGIMDMVNLAHGSLYMVGAYFAATFVALTDSFVLGALLALGASIAFQRVRACRAPCPPTESMRAARSMVGTAHESHCC